MPDPISDTALLSMCMTWRHDFGLLDRKEQRAIKRELLGLYEHHVKPAIDRASSAESSLTAMRQRAEEVERQRDGYKKACNDVVGEMIAKDEQDRIGNHIASLLSYTMIVQGLPAGMVNSQAFRENIELWREAQKMVNTDDISTVQSYRAERDAATARAERVEDINKRLFNACRERNMRISDLTQRAERAEALLAELDTLLLGSLAALGIPTPVEGYRAAGWSLLGGDLKRAIKAKGLVKEALLRCQRLADDGVDDPAGPYNVLAQIANTVAAALPSPPSDASTMVGERCDTCPHDPETCDRAECSAWGKSEEAKERVLIREANRPLTDEEHAIVDAGYERGKQILSDVRNDERERQYMEALAAYANDEDRYNRGDGEPYGSIPVEVGAIARQARAILAEMEKQP